MMRRGSADRVTIPMSAEGPHFSGAQKTVIIFAPPSG